MFDDAEVCTKQSTDSELLEDLKKNYVLTFSFHQVASCGSTAVLSYLAQDYPLR